jgi:hypothetical protein
MKYIQNQKNKKSKTQKNKKTKLTNPIKTLSYPERFAWYGDAPGIRV